MLTRVLHYVDALPDGLREGLAEERARLRDVPLAPFGEPVGARLRAAVGHAVAFWTWRSLCVDHGHPDEVAVFAMTTLVLGSRGR